MKSLTVAISSLIAGFLLGNLYNEKYGHVPPSPPPPPTEPTVPAGMTEYKFFCWLCSGETNFACKSSGQDKHYNLECCRCGMDNRVKVEQKVQKE